MSTQNPVDTTPLFDAERRLSQIITDMIRSDEPRSDNFPYLMFTHGSLIALLNNRAGGGTLSPHAVEEALKQAAMWIRNYERSAGETD